jgi:uncharacterized protein (TIGR02001 family)
MKTIKRLALASLLAGSTITPQAYANDFSANVTVTNNYIWRGLTQTENNPAVQGGVDWTSDFGLYVGTWVSNVSYAPAGVFNYENDLYAGFAGGSDTFSWDVGYLYYNYDENANFDFGEIYGAINIYGLNLSLNILANTEAKESDFPDANGNPADFGFGSAYYVAADYAFSLFGGLDLGLHVGYHDGDFVEAFNIVDGGYADWNISLSRGGFSLMLTNSTAGGEAADIFGLDNDQPKIVVSYTVDFDLLSD